ncbi:HAD hydrolase family protein [Treponema primitia]|uniref:KdsC family phosphatase n=1 Tax=Treponema primitia TaxID=88058 RepID=UPI0039805481
MAIEISDIPLSLIVYDFDGVMTDNTVIVGEDGRESVICNRSDGLAVSIIKEWGLLQIIISTEENDVVACRAKKLKIPVIHGIAKKNEAVFAYCKDKNIKLEETLYIGNDLNDLEAMLAVGYPVCPNDAYREIKEISKLILPVNGGHGVIRELLYYLKKGKHD